MPCTIVPQLMGGLGNWLFQVAAAVKFSQDAEVNYVLAKDRSSQSPHSPEADYFSTIFLQFKQREHLRHVGCQQFTEPPNFNHTSNYALSVYNLRDLDIDTLLVGYFQNHLFIPKTFKYMLTLPTVDSSRVRETCFIHIRGGDYVNHSFHDLKLAQYYRKCIERVQNEHGVKKFSIFTNDKPYALKQEFLKDIDYEFVDASETESLVLMSECRAGICANSSFSWWGAYLNANRPIYMPSKWFNDPTMNISGYYFPGVSVVQV